MNNIDEGVSHAGSLSDKGKFYVSTAIAYANAKPHLGHALEFVMGDVFARYNRFLGKDTYFLTGSDEHGTKIYKAAGEKDMELQEFVDENAKQFVEMTEKLMMTNDQFIRTTSEEHKVGVKALWEKLVEAGDIYLNKYSGLYCSGCEAFLLEKDLVDGKCPNHLKEPEVVKEENYFFRLSKYSEKIGELIRSGELLVEPKARRNEILKIIEDGLQDVSFSRPKSVLPWGIEVPNDPEQVMYVWCDALANYITALGYPNDEDGQMAKYWPCDLHIVGKDILRFHAGVWIGMLLAAGLELPKMIGVHGFVTSEGQKMSKSLGNVVDPMILLDEASSDAVRYYLMREIPTGADGDFSKERFKIVYESDLANNFGNLASRSVAMVHKYFEGEVPVLKEFVFAEEFEKTLKKYEEFMESFDIKKAIEAVLEFLTSLNQFVENEKPWALAKEERREELEHVMANLVEGVRLGMYLLAPVIPEATAKLAEALKCDLKMGLEEVLEQKMNEVRLEKLEPLFPRIVE